MIDTDKYEGHNISKMQCGSDSTATIDERKANWNLVQDAPLLLAEVKRLREDKRFVELEHGIALDNREAQVTIRLNQHYEKQHEKLLAEVKRLREIINKAMQQHTVLEMREQLFESQCIDAEGQYESGHWERDEE